MTHATQFWLTGPATGAMRTASLLDDPPAGMVRVRTLYSAISRGTERLIAAGQVPPSLADMMRAPFQQGDFPFPVSYGYAAVGRIIAAGDGAGAGLGQRVFALHPHHDLFDIPAAAAIPLPDGLPSRRATLAANLETALNATWDAAPLPGDRICVVGGGMVGLLIAALCARLPGARVELIDIDPARAALAESVGARFALPAAATPGADLLFHCSASDAGLALCLDLAGFEAVIIELSWYGTHPVAVPLGGAFHARRLTLKCSQVGSIAPARRARRDYRARLTTALDLLGDPGFDALLGPSLSFSDLVALYHAALHGQDARAPVIGYGVDGE